VTCTDEVFGKGRLTRHRLDSGDDLGREDAGPTRAVPVVQPSQPLDGEPLPPLADRVSIDGNPFGDTHVRHTRAANSTIRARTTTANGAE